MEFRPMVEDDAEQVLRMREAAFGLPRPPDDAPPELDGEYHVVVDGADVLGVLRVFRWSQWFGGNAVPTAGVASVTVAPHARGRGVGKRLVERTLRMLRDEGVALSTLYPSTAAPYRRAGYEFAGSRVRYQVRLADLPTDAGDGVEPWDDDALDDVRDFYARYAAGGNGLLDRGEGTWKAAVLAPSTDRTAFRYLVREAGQVTGYVVFSLERDTGRMPFRYVPGDTTYNYQLACRDLLFTTRDAATRLLGFLAGHRAMGTDVLWTGPLNDPIDNLLPALYGMPQTRSLWMLRVVDVPAALEARGYPLDLDTATEFTVRDDTVGVNERAYRLEVSGGAGKVSEIGDADVELDTRALASLYASWHDPVDVARIGTLRGAGPGDVSALRSIFAGPTPWMLDMF